jgi:hypothetical protein
VDHAGLELRVEQQLVQAAQRATAEDPVDLGDRIPRDVLVSCCHSIRQSSQQVASEHRDL